MKLIDSYQGTTSFLFNPHEPPVALVITKNHTRITPVNRPAIGYIGKILIWLMSYEYLKIQNLRRRRSGRNEENIFVRYFRNCYFISL